MIRKSTIAAVRFGYGFHPTQPPPADAEALLAQVAPGRVAEPAVARDGFEPRVDMRARLREMRGGPDGGSDVQKEARRRGLRDVSQALLRRAMSAEGFHERLVAFWFDHFAVSLPTVTQVYFFGSYEDESIRPHVTGRFADMLKAVVRAPAMLHYLDQSASFGPNSWAGRKRGLGLNENLAREILELHTLGVRADYTQKDVREFAELLTGFAWRPQKGDFVFLPGRAEPGAETVLGRTYGGNPPREADVDAALEDLARHPATARHLARKLAVHFVADEPDPDLIAHLAAAWEAGGGDLPRVYRALLEHPASWTGPGAKVKRPQDLIASTLRAIGLGAAPDEETAAKRGQTFVRALRLMNQPYMQPPGPDGWPEPAGDWITPQGLAGRLQFAGMAARWLAANAQRDPRHFAEAALGELLRETTRGAVAQAADRWEGFALAIASPEFNRR